MSAETRTVTIEVTRRQSDFIFGFITLNIEQWLNVEEGKPLTLGDIQATAAILGILNEELREEMESDDPNVFMGPNSPALLAIAKAIHKPFCNHHGQENKTDASTGLYI